MFEINKFEKVGHELLKLGPKDYDTDPLDHNQRHGYGVKFMCGCGIDHPISNEIHHYKKEKDKIYTVLYGMWPAKITIPTVGSCYKLLRCFNDYYTLIMHSGTFKGTLPYVVETGFMFTKIKTESIWFATSDVIDEYRTKRDHRIFFHGDLDWKKNIQSLEKMKLENNR